MKSGGNDENFGEKRKGIEDYLYFCRCICPDTAVRHTEVCGAGWVEYYILKGVTDALFLDIRTSTID